MNPRRSGSQARAQEVSGRGRRGRARPADHIVGPEPEEELVEFLAERNIMAAV